MSLLRAVRGGGRGLGPRRATAAASQLAALTLLGPSILAGCGGGSSMASAQQATVRSASSSVQWNNSAGPPSPGHRALAREAAAGGDWTRFDFDAQRSGVGPADTGITGRNLRGLKIRRVRLDGTIDSSAIELHGIRVRGRVRDVAVGTTTYGRTIALDPGTGTKLWEYVPPVIRTYQGTSQITTASPVADPDRRYVYAASPDGRIRKLVLATGHEVRSRSWPAPVTTEPTHEKIASALNLSGANVVAVTGGYLGDAPPYQGHVVLISRSTGRVVRVWNSLCSNRTSLIRPPSSCGVSNSAIWSRGGAVIEPGSGRILISTGNGPFDGSTNWGDSVIELSPRLTPLHNWTPVNQRQLEASDGDLGSGGPAILPVTAGLHLAVQGDKENKLYLLNLDRLNGTTGRAGARKGGELEQTPAPGGAQILTQPATWRHGGRTYVFVADNNGTAAYVVTGGGRPRLSRVGQNPAAGTSPVLAGGLLYVYDPAGSLKVYEPTRLRQLASLPAASGHWNSPIVIGGRIIVPEGDANRHSTSGTIDIYHLPGR